MSLYPEPYFQKLAALLRQAGMPVVTDPHTGPLHARVRELLDAGILVCLGQDDVSDAYYPFGRNNMLEVAFLASHLQATSFFSNTAGNRFNSSLRGSTSKPPDSSAVTPSSGCASSSP